MLEIERQRELGKEVVFRGHAAFAKPEIYEAQEERGVKYAIRYCYETRLDSDEKSFQFSPPFSKATGATASP
jgi:hypothetical protein